MQFLAQRFAHTFFLLAPFAQAIISEVHAQKFQCRCMPGDTCWPDSVAWNNLNETTGGKLISTVPLAQACHSPKFNASQCQNLQNEWTSPFLQYVFSAQLLYERMNVF